MLGKISLGLIVCCTIAAAQSNPATGNSHLEVSSSVLSAEPGSALMAPIRCDNSGNIYVRRYAMDSGSKAPVLKFDSQGTGIGQFKLESIASLPENHGGIGDFNIGPHGEVYLLVYTSDPPAATIFSFDANGVFEKKVATLYDEYRSANKIAVLNDGKLVVTGIEPASKENPNPHKPWTAIFDHNGKLMHVLHPEQDVEIEKAAESGNPYFIDGRGHGNWAVSLGTMVTGGDGNVYLLRRTAPATVYVISAEGKLIRTLSIGDSVHVPRSLFWADDKLALLFNDLNGTGGNDAFWAIASARTGQEMARYSGSEGTDLGGAFACYDGTNFTFLGVQKSHMLVKRAAPSKQTAAN